MKRIIAFTTLTGICFIFCLAHILTNAVAIDYIGFAVDGSEFLYVGGGHQIRVYDGNKLTKTITNGTERGFAFTIQNGNTIILSNASIVYEMDLDGNIKNEYPDPKNQVFSKLQRNKTFTAINGKTYQYRCSWGRTQIYCDGQLIYKMPLYDYCIKLLLCISVCSFFGCVLVIVCRTSPILDQYRKHK